MMMSELFFEYRINFEEIYLSRMIIYEGKLKAFELFIVYIFWLGN